MIMYPSRGRTCIFFILFISIFYIIYYFTCIFFLLFNYNNIIYIILPVYNSSFAFGSRHHQNDEQAEKRNRECFHDDLYNKLDF